MSREITADFSSLEAFIRSFNLSSICDEPDLLSSLKPLHKRMFSLMTFVAELDQEKHGEIYISAEGLVYLKESASDLGQALFCWLQGAYKPANLILRSSIETFIKSLAGQENNSVFSEKRVYQVFELASETKYFKGLCSNSFSNIHSSYKRLCLMAHSAGVANMSHISALKTFPVFSPQEAPKFCNEFVSILNMVLSILYVNFFKFIHTMHHQNFNNFVCSVPKSIKRDFNNNLG